MSRITIRIRGASDFKAANQAFMQQLIAQANAGLDSIADITKDEAQRLCPVGTPESTGIKGYVGGTLRDAHEIMPDVEDTYRFIRYLYNDTYYARWVHDGTYKMPARPWLMNAVWRTRSQFLPEMMRV